MNITKRVIYRNLLLSLFTAVIIFIVAMYGFTAAFLTAVAGLIAYVTALVENQM